MSALGTQLAHELRARWKGVVGLGVLLGVVLGGVMVSAAGARRTETAYDRYLDSANAEDYSVGLPNPEDPVFPFFMDGVTSFPEVAAVAPIASMELVAAEGSVGDPDATTGFLSLAGFDDRFGRETDIPKLAEGRMTDPDDPDELLINEAMADEFGLEVGGEFVAYGLPGGPRANPSADPDVERDGRRQVFTVTGIGVFPNEVVATAPLDDLPRVYPTPAYVQAHPDEMEEFGFLAIRLRSPSERGEFRRHLEEFLTENGVPTSAVPLLDAASRRDSVNRAIEPQAQALYGFTVLLGLTAVLVLGQAVSRHLAADRDARATAWALGYTRPQLIGVSVIRVAVILGLATVVAVGVAVAGSAWMPFGPAAIAEPDPGLDIDVTVFVLGVVALFAVFLVWTVIAAWRSLDTPLEAGSGRRGFRLSHRPRVVTALTASGAPPTAVAGVQMAFQPGAGSSLPTASAMVGTTIALAAFVAALTFGVNLDRLVETPRLYGWDWDVQVGGGFDGIPTGPAVRAIRGNPAVEAFSGGNSTEIGFQPDGEARTVPVPVLGLDPIEGEVYPPLIEGRVAGDGETVLGTTTMEELGVELGDHVVAELPGREEPTPLAVVGRAVLPAIGAGNFATTGLGRGAVLPAGVLDDPEEPGTYTYFLLDYAPGVDQEQANVEIQREIEQLIPDDCADLSCVGGARRPGDISNYARVRGTPLLLAGMLAFLGAGVLVHTLVTGVRRHRRDLGLLASIGFVRRQIGATVVWQSATVAVVSVVVGLPLGIVLGRFLWTTFAEDLGVVVDVHVPLGAILLAAPLAILVAIGIALVPALAAARTHPAAAVRSE